jgi:hypothetical protein
VPTLFDAANPHVLKGQPHPTDDESRAHSAANVRPTSECLVAKAARHATNNTNATPITMSAGMILLFLHRLAGRPVVLEWSTGSFWPFMVTPRHTPARGAWADPNGGLPETPWAKQTITRRAVLPAVEHARQMGCPSQGTVTLIEKCSGAQLSLKQSRPNTVGSFTFQAAASGAVT